MRLTALLLVTLLPGITTTAAAADAYDVTRYELRIVPEIAARRLAVEAAVSIDNPNRATEFSFGLNARYSTVEVREGRRVVPHELRDGVVTVKTPPRDTVKLSFKLAGALGDSGDDPRAVVDDSTVYLLWSDRFYPIAFDDWASMRISIVLPGRFEVIAPGRRIARKADADVVEHVFETTRPTVCASVIAHDGWTRTEHASGPVPIVTLLDAESQTHASAIAKTSAEVIATYADVYGGYPFDDFAFVTIPGIYARRAFPGFVGYSPTYLEQEMRRTGHDAHETALLWWGYTLRGSGPGGFQWTEGFGDYAEMIYGERFDKPLPHNFARFRSAYLARPNGTDPHYTAVRGNQQEIVHGRYPWLMHLLRYRLGDAKFKAAMRLLFTRFAHRTFTVDELVATIEEGAGGSIRWWREEWLERRGTPQWTASTSIREDAGEWVTTVSVAQHGDLYHVPVEIALSGPETRLVTLDVSGETARGEFRTPFRPHEVKIDPRGWILMRLTMQEDTSQ